MANWLDSIKTWMGWKTLSEEEYQRERTKLLGNAPVPVFWLFGKTGSGKSSIVRFLTGAEDAEIGNGFRPQTRCSRQFDFPSPENPLLRFLDTRGLGESAYDPTEDLAAFDQSTHVLVVTARAMDHALAMIVEPLRSVRAAKPDRPIVLALTCLHEAYPQQQHPHPDPFPLAMRPEALSEQLPTTLPDALRRSLAEQALRFQGLVDYLVPLDLTPPDDGFEQPLLGGDRLKQTLLDVLPGAYRQTLLDFDMAMKSLDDLNERRAMPFVLSYSTMASTAAAIPVAWVDIPVVMGIQSHLVYQLAKIYSQPMNRELLLQLAGALGGRMVARQIVRGPLKIIPGLGSLTNAALAYAYTYALGKACCWYFGQVKRGNAPAPSELNRVWNEQLLLAGKLWQRREEQPQS